MTLFLVKLTVYCNRFQYDRTGILKCILKCKLNVAISSRGLLAHILKKKNVNYKDTKLSKSDILQMGAMLTSTFEIFLSLNF